MKMRFGKSSGLQGADKFFRIDLRQIAEVVVRVGLLELQDHLVRVAVIWNGYKVGINVGRVYILLTFTL